MVALLIVSKLSIVSALPKDESWRPPLPGTEEREIYDEVRKDAREYQKFLEARHFTKAGCHAIFGGGVKQQWVRGPIEHDVIIDNPDAYCDGVEVKFRRSLLERVLWLVGGVALGFLTKGALR